MHIIGNKTSANASILRLSCMATLLAFVGGCSSFPGLLGGSRAARPGTPSAAEPVPEVISGRFAIAASMLDTWNAVGQILVALDGVHYEGRAQMLGIYAVRYRGERFLILTRARVIENAGDGMVTEVDAVGHNGQSIVSHAAVELLARLQQRLPAELARIAALQRIKGGGGK